MPRAPKSSERRNATLERYIKRLQKSTKLLLPKKAFYWLVKEITNEYKFDLKHQANAMLALQDASEAYLDEMFRGSLQAAEHAERKTVCPKDIQFWLKTKVYPKHI